MFSKEKGENIISALSGNVISLDEVSSPIFAGKVVGDGIAIVPYDGMVVSPITGVISFVGVQKHSYGITSFDGIEVLIHLGIGTVALNGEGFTPFVEKGDKVNAGDPICNVDWNIVKDHNLDITSPIVITSQSVEMIKRLTIYQGLATAGKTACMHYILKK